MPTHERRDLSAPSLEKKKERTPREEVDAVLEEVKARWRSEDPASFALLLKVFEHSIPDALRLASDVGLDTRGYRYLVGHGLPMINTKHSKIRDLVYEEIDALKKRGLRSEISSPAISIGAAPPEMVSRIETAYARVLAERAKGMDLKQLKDLPIKTDEEDAAYRLAATHLNRVTDVWQGVMTLQDARAMFHQYGLDQDEELMKKFFSNRVDEVPTNEVMEALRGYLPKKMFDTNSRKITEELNTRRVKLTAPIYAVEKMEAEKRLKDVLNQKLSASGKEVALDEKGEYVVRKTEEENKIEKESAVKWEVVEVPPDHPAIHETIASPDEESPLVNRVTLLGSRDLPFSVPDWRVSVALYEIEGKSYLEYEDRNGNYHLTDKNGQDVFRKLKDDHGNPIEATAFTRPVVTRSGVLISAEHRGSTYVWDMDGNLVTNVQSPKHAINSFWVLDGAMQGTTFELRHELVTGLSGEEAVKVIHRFVIRPRRTEGTAEKREWKPSIPEWIEARGLERTPDEFYRELQPAAQTENREIQLDRTSLPFPVPDWRETHALFGVGERQFLSYDDSKNRYRIVDQSGVDMGEIVHDEQGKKVDVKLSWNSMQVNEAGALFCGSSPSRKMFLLWDIHGNIIAQRKMGKGLEMYISHSSPGGVFNVSYRDGVDDSLLEHIRIAPNPDRARIAEQKAGEKEVVLDSERDIADGLQLLNAVHDPKSREQLRKLSGLWDVKLAQAPKRIWNAEAMRRAILAEPARFLKTVPAVPDDAPKHLAHQLVMRMFPEMFRTELHGKGIGGRLRDWWKSEKPDPRGALRVRGETALRGGGVETLKDSRTVLELREPMRGFLATGMYGACGKENGVWKELDFPLQREKNASSVVTAVVPNAGELGRAVLPTPLNGEVIAERVKVQMKKGERALEVDRRSTGINEATIPTDAKTLAYTFTAGPEQPLKDVSKVEMDRFLKMLSDISPDVAQDLRSVPARIPQAFLVGLFTPELKKLDPKQQVVAIERFVRDNGFYDVHNEVVSETKLGKPLDEQWALCQDRARSLKTGKRFAGVCADYAGLTTALLRKAGFAAGVVEGYGVDGKEVQVKDSHAAAFVLWPDASGKPRAVLVDGTPPSTEAVARHIAMPSMEDREKKAEGEGGAAFEESVKKLEALERALQSDDPTALRGLWNGKLEHAVNAILGAVRPGHARAVRALLDGYWYSPLAHMDPTKPGFREALVGGLQGVLAYEREHIPVNEDGNKTAGRTAFIAIEDFADRLVKSHTVRSSADAYRAVREIVELAEPMLEKDERRVFEAVTAYLEAKKMFG